LEDSLKRLDKLTNEEVRMATAEVLKMTHAIDEGVTGVSEQLAEVINGAQIIFSET
jgi:exopolyphosphatase/pppGpp-phosphohydrolase